MDGRRTTDINGPQWTTGHAEHNQRNSKPLPHWIWKRKKKNPKNRTLKEDANHQTRWNDPRIDKQIQILRRNAQWKGQLRNPYPRSQRQSGMLSVPNHPIHSREQTVQKHTNGSNMDHGRSMHNPHNHLCRRDQKPHKQGKIRTKPDPGQNIKRILLVPTSTPREALYTETGIMGIEHTTMKNRLNMDKRRQTNPNSLTSKVKEVGTKNGWKQKTEDIKKKSLQINPTDMEGTKNQTKGKIRTKVENAQKVTNNHW